MKRIIERLLLAVLLTVAPAIQANVQDDEIIIHNEYVRELRNVTNGSRGYYLTIYTDCVYESDICFSYYKYGTTPTKGMRLNECFEDNGMNYYSKLSAQKTAAVEAQFRRLTGSPKSKLDEDEYIYAQSADGRTEMYWVGKDANVTIYIFKNGILESKGVWSYD